MQRNLLFLQQAMARQAQQQRVVNGANVGMEWAQQPQRIQPPSSPFQPPVEDSRLKQQRLQQQRMASLFMQQRETQQEIQQMKPMQRQSSTLSAPPPTPPNAILVQTETQQKNLDLYLHRDQQYQVSLDAQHKKHMELATSKKHDIDVANNERRLRNSNKGMLVFGKGYDGYGNGKTGTGHVRIVYPSDKKRKRNHHSVRISYETSSEQANKEETLVPIRLDLENEGYKIRDTFTWNMNETSITPEQFADITCEDLRLPIPIFSPLIANSIREQIQEFFVNASSMIQNETEIEVINAYEELSNFKKQKLENTKNVNIENTTLIERAINENKPELRTIIKLDIIVGNRILNDQFEWDITCKKNSPESFADNMAKDLGLGGEFKTAIAHSIREQVYVYIKSLLLTGYEFGDGPVEHDELRRSFLPRVNNVFRDAGYIENFTPSLIELTDAEIAKIEKVRTRESRRKRRGIRNRKGVVLPDREPIPTFRTIFASPPEHEMTDEQFLKSMQTNQEGGQRKSAVKARMNIAAEAAGVSLTSGQLVNGSTIDDHHSFQANADVATRPASSKLMDSTWKCGDCGCSPFMTSIVRSGPNGDKTLCNACGLYRYKYNGIRPPNYLDKEIKNDVPYHNDWQSQMTRYRA